LGALVASTKEHYDRIPVSSKVRPVTWAVVDPKLNDSFTDRFRVAKISKANTSNPRFNLSNCPLITNSIEPRSKRLFAVLFSKYDYPLLFGFDAVYKCNLKVTRRQPLNLSLK
jgi:hypothetical protein